MRAHATAITIILAVAAHAPARAQGEAPPDQRVLVVLLTGDASGPHAGLPEVLSRSLAGVIARSGAHVTRASVDDVLGLAGCGEPSDDCLQQALDILEVGRVVLGEVDASSGHVQVRLRLIAAARPARSRTIALTGGDSAALEREFRAAAAAFWRDPEGAPTPAAAAAASPEGSDAPAIPAATAAAAPEARARFSARRVSRLAWGIAGGGVGLAAVGGLLLVGAANKQGQVDDAPTATPQDLERLVDLEQSGRSYARWGTAFLVVGTVAAGAGAAFIYKQGTETGRDEGATAPGSSLALVPALVTRGGLGVTLMLRVRR